MSGGEGGIRLRFERAEGEFGAAESGLNATNEDEVEMSGGEGGILNSQAPQSAPDFKNRPEQKQSNQ